MVNDEDRLDELFQRYRESCPDLEPGANFMPLLWRRIEAKSTFWLMFERLGTKVTTASAALCLVLLALNLISGSNSLPLASTYMDALMADHSAERTYYTEALGSNTADSKTPSSPGSSH